MYFDDNVAGKYSYTVFDLARRAVTWTRPLDKSRAIQEYMDNNRSQFLDLITGGLDVILQHGTYSYQNLQVVVGGYTRSITLNVIIKSVTTTNNTEGSVKLRVEWTDNTSVLDNSHGRTREGYVVQASDATGGASPIRQYSSAIDLSDVDNA